MPDPARSILPGPLLKSVSRSFYLTLRVLPVGMRDPVGLAYLLARAADTIADTAILPPQKRLELLLSFREQVNGLPQTQALQYIEAEVAASQEDSDEKVLLASLGDALGILSELDADDREAVREIVTTLTEGMEFDLRTFPDESSGQLAALREFAELDHYTYMVAGCVGEFWTKMTCVYVPHAIPEPVEAMMGRGVRFGKALQLTNILRDCGKDLRIGRCYLPETMLARYGLTPPDLLAPENSLRARPLLYELLKTALDHYRAAIAYTLALPRFSMRLRLACIWPAFIGLETLLLLVQNDHWLDPARASKIRRNDVYRIMARSFVMVSSNRLLQAWADGLMQSIEARIQRT